MGNSLHIVYYIEMKNMHKDMDEKHKHLCKYTKLFRKTHNECLQPSKDTIMDTMPNNDYINEEKKLKNWLEFVESW